MSHVKFSRKLGMKDKIGFDFMAKSNSHCLYQLGAFYHGYCSKFYLHSSSKIYEANKFYRGGNLALNVTLTNYFLMLLSLIKESGNKNKIVIIGAHLWQIIMLTPILCFSSVQVHLHGQASGLFRRNTLKYYAWKILAYKFDLVVSNPAWDGPNFVRQINNVHLLKYEPRFIDNFSKNKVLIYRAAGFGAKVEKNIFKSLANLGFEIIIPERNDNSLISFEEINKVLNSVEFIFFDSSNGYYFFSPSGRISDAINYSLKILVSSKDYYGIQILKKYNANFLVFE